MKLLTTIFLTSTFFLIGCKKNCWHCTAITNQRVLYIKNEDTIVVYFVENSNPNYRDSLQRAGYQYYRVGVEEIPIDYTFCNEGVNIKPFEKCYRVK